MHGHIQFPMFEPKKRSIWLSSKSATNQEFRKVRVDFESRDQLVMVGYVEPAESFLSLRHERSADRIVMVNYRPNSGVRRPWSGSVFVRECGIPNLFLQSPEEGTAVATVFETPVKGGTGMIKFWFISTNTFKTNKLRLEDPSTGVSRVKRGTMQQLVCISVLKKYTCRQNRTVVKMTFINHSIEELSNLSSSIKCDMNARN